MVPPAIDLDGTDITTLTDEQLSDFLADVDAAEIVSKAKPVVMGEAAAWYAEALAWPVFPLKPRGKQPLTRHGFKDASVDPDVIHSWWERWPAANIGVPTGADGCGYDVVDLDGVEGIKSWALMRHADCPDGCTAETFCPAPGPFDVRARAFTPGDGNDRKPGRHLYIPATGRGNGAALGPGIDFRGAGGFCVVAPSMGPHGARYSWLEWPEAAA